VRAAAFRKPRDAAAGRRQLTHYVRANETARPPRSTRAIDTGSGCDPPQCGGRGGAAAAGVDGARAARGQPLFAWSLKALERWTRGRDVVVGPDARHLREGGDRPRKVAAWTGRRRQYLQPLGGSLSSTCLARGLRVVAVRLARARDDPT
jgi:hypothetical protein